MSSRACDYPPALQTSRELSIVLGFKGVYVCSLKWGVVRLTGVLYIPQRRESSLNLKSLKNYRLKRNFTTLVHLKKKHKNFVKALLHRERFCEPCLATFCIVAVYNVGIRSLATPCSCVTRLFGIRRK